MPLANACIVLVAKKQGAVPEPVCGPPDLSDGAITFSPLTIASDRVCLTSPFVQLTMLPNLQHLKLVAGYSPASLEALSALSGSLTRLEVSTGSLPPSLSALTRLQQLELICWRDGPTAMLDGALQALTQLTCLVSWDGREGGGVRCHRATVVWALSPGLCAFLCVAARPAGCSLRLFLPK